MDIASTQQHLTAAAVAVVVSRVRAGMAQQGRAWGGWASSLLAWKRLRRAAAEPGTGATHTACAVLPGRRARAPSAAPLAGRRMLRGIHSENGLEPQGLFGGRAEMEAGMGAVAAGSTPLDGDPEAAEPEARLAEYPLLSAVYLGYLQPPAGSGACEVLPEAAGFRQGLLALQPVLAANYRRCMQRAATSLLLSCAELGETLERHAAAVAFAREPGTAGGRQLLLVPLAGASVPQWIPAGGRLAVGRQCALFAGAAWAVSRTHCDVFHSVHAYYVQERGSRNGTFVNGAAVAAGGQPTELRHGDIVQFGVDIASEVDPFRQLAAGFRAAQCLVLYGYPAQAEAAAGPSEPVLPPALGCGSLARRCLGRVRQVLARCPAPDSATARLVVRLGGASAGTAVLHQGPILAYTFAFNSYAGSWSVSMTCRQTGRILGLRSEGPAVYRVAEGHDQEHTLAELTVASGHSLLIEPRPAHRHDSGRGSGNGNGAEDGNVNQNGNGDATANRNGSNSGLEIPLTPAYVLASPVAGASKSSRPAAIFAPPSIQPERVPAGCMADLPRDPCYTLMGDPHGGGLVYCMERGAGTREQRLAGQGRVVAGRHARTLVFEGRTETAPEHAGLLAIATLFNVLHRLVPAGPQPA